MDRTAHFPSLLLALGPPDGINESWTAPEYERDFIAFCLRADVLGFNAPNRWPYHSVRYPLSVSEKSAMYLPLFYEFLKWCENAESATHKK